LLLGDLVELGLGSARLRLLVVGLLVVALFLRLGLGGLLLLVALALVDDGLDRRIDVGVAALGVALLAVLARRCALGVLGRGRALRSGRASRRRATRGRRGSAGGLGRHVLLLVLERLPLRDDAGRARLDLRPRRRSTAT